MVVTVSVGVPRDGIAWLLYEISMISGLVIGDGWRSNAYIQGLLYPQACTLNLVGVYERPFICKQTYSFPCKFLKKV